MGWDRILYRMNSSVRCQFNPLLLQLNSRCNEYPQSAHLVVHCWHSFLSINLVDFSAVVVVNRALYNNYGVDRLYNDNIRSHKFRRKKNVYYVFFSQETKKM